MSDHLDHSEAIQEWLRRAEEPMKSSDALLRNQEGAPSTVCFLSHQIAELSLKALIEAKATKMPRTHALPDLVDIISAYIPRSHQLYEDSVLLNPYYLETRYDIGIKIEDFTWPLAQQAFESAERIYNFAKQHALD